jgi:ABC-type polysaccharide/polyol phosphate transport system ATPase subunit
MSGHAIRISGLSKVFRVWHQPRDMLIEAISGRRRHTEFQALTDVNLEVPHGTVVGIMGRNGAGKSTLLRIVAGTLDASAGTVSVDGKVSAILELGTGFHPEYSGRENVFLGGLCLGLNRNEIARRFDDIVEFAELAEVIDRPFRTYSSGMQARLTFAVATSVDAEVLIIDEALAVGDARFQLKSFDRVRGFRKQGKSILLVSHDINQIVSVCDRAILLDGGRIVADGEPGRIGNLYHELLFGPRPSLPPAALPKVHPAPQKFVAEEVTRHTPEPVLELMEETSGGQASASHEKPSAPEPMDTAAPPALVTDAIRRPHRSIMEAVFSDEQSPTAAPPTRLDSPVNAKAEHRYGDGRARILDIHIRDLSGRPVRHLRSLEEYELVCRIEALDEMDSLCFGFLVRDRRGLDLFGWDMLNGGHRPLPFFFAGEQRDVIVGFKANMAAGAYFLTVALARWHDGHKYDVRFDSFDFAVDSTPHLQTASVVNLDPRLKLRSDSESDR